MATDLEKLVVQLSADFKSFEKSLARANGATNKQFNAIERRARQMNKNLDGIFARSFKGLAAPMAGIGAALGTAELIKLADTWSDLTSRVNIAAGSMETGADVMERLGEMARRTYSSLEQTVESYVANSTALKELGYSTNQQLDYTEALNNALVISAAKGQRAAQIQDALAKAMAGGKLSGQELNTVIQSGGRVAEALAKGLGVGVNELRALGAAGRITSRDVFKALTSQMETLRKEAESMPATISDGIQLLQNAMLEYVGNADQATGVSGKISEALVIMADNFDKTADVALQLAGVIAGALIGRSLLKMISTLGLAGKALHDFTRALAAARTMGGLAAAFGGLSAAAGPVGLLIGGAVVTSLIAYSSATADATAASRTYEVALEAVRAKAGEVADAVDEAAGKIDAKTENMLSRGVDHGVSEIARLRSEILSLMEQYDLLSIRRVVEPEQLRQIDEFREKFDDGTESVQDLENRLFALANASPDMQMLAERLSPLLMALREAIAATDILQQKLGAPDRATIEAYQQYGASRVAGRAVDESSAAYIREAERRAKLGKDQLALETEIARVREQSLKDGEMLTDAQIKQIAKINLAGNKTRSEEGKKTAAPKKTGDDRFENLTQSIYDRIAAMKIEADTTGLVYQEQEKRRMALELEQEALKIAREEARKKGDQDWQNAKLTPEQIAKINEMSEAYAQQADALRLIEEAQGRAESAASEFYDTFKSGMIGALKGAESFSDALSKILERLADMVLNSAFDALFNGATGSGGWLTGIFKGLGFSKGGYTGSGPKDKPAGIVHAGEVVWSQDDIARAGGVGVVEAMRKGMAMPGQMQAPSMPKLAAASGGSSSVTVSIPINIDAPGADAAALARVEQQVQKLQRDLPGTVIATVRQMPGKNIK